MQGTSVALYMYIFEDVAATESNYLAAVSCEGPYSLSIYLSKETSKKYHSLVTISLSFEFCTH